MVASQGLEPQQAESESAVLPLHHEAISRLSVLAGSTGLEPATPGSTVQCANQLRHDPRVPESGNIISNPPYRMQGGNLIFLYFSQKIFISAKNRLFLRHFSQIYPIHLSIKIFRIGIFSLLRTKILKCPVPNIECIDKSLQHFKRLFRVKIV